MTFSRRDGVYSYFMKEALEEAKKHMNWMKFPLALLLLKMERS